MTSKNITAASTTSICAMVPGFLALTASVTTWTQAKLPVTRRNWNIQSNGAMTTGLGSKPVMLPNTSTSVGCSVNVKIVASIAHQMVSTMKATHGTPGWK